MANGMYEVAALLPASSDFTLERAVEYFSSRTFTIINNDGSAQRNIPVRAELATTPDGQEPGGFRVWYGPWAVHAWLEEGKQALRNSQDHLGESGLPAPDEVIAGCSRWLWVCSDECEPDFENSDRITEYTTDLRERFGAFIKDYVCGGWWT